MKKWKSRKERKKKRPQRVYQPRRLKKMICLKKCHKKTCSNWGQKNEEIKTRGKERKKTIRKKQPQTLKVELRPSGVLLVWRLCIDFFVDNLEAELDHFFFNFFFKKISLLAWVSVFKYRCFLRSRCSMEMWCPDDTRRDSWGWFGPPASRRARFNSPEWRLLACLKPSLPRLYYCCCCWCCCLCCCKTEQSSISSYCKNDFPLWKFVFFWAKVNKGVGSGPFGSDLRCHFFILSFKCFSLPASLSEFNCKMFPAKYSRPYDRQFGEVFMIPFGSMVDYHNISAKDQSRLHEFGNKVLPGIFLGYALDARGIWQGSSLVADIEELEILDVSEIRARRLNAKEVLTPKNGEHFIFPIAGGTFKLAGGDQGIRKSTLIRDDPERGELRDDLRGESDGSQRIDTMMDDREVRNDFWSIEGNYMYRHHVGPGVSSLCRRKNHSQCHCDTLTWSGRTHATSDVMQESRTDDWWNIDVGRILSDSWTVFTKFT